MFSETCLGLSWAQRMAGFMLFAIAGLGFLGLALAALPTIVIGGFSKFGISYTFANVLLIGSTAFLVGVEKQMGMMFQKERLSYTVGYLTSMVATVYLIFYGYHFYFT